jgi:phytoene synthase
VSAAASPARASSGASSGPGPGEAREHVRAVLAALARDVEGMPELALDGQLIRPLAAYAAARTRGAADDGRVWCAALAVQLAHEASLVHDDVVDGAATRRGRATLAAAAGTGAALVHGDHLLTWAYRMAARTGSLAFAELFAEAVERTVAGEVAQGRALGRAPAPGEYERVARDKAGALLGCALAAPAAVCGRAGDAGAGVRDLYELGRALGLVYQRLDDLLDWCTRTDTGKPPLGDHAQRRWTWVLSELPPAAFAAPAHEVLAALHASPGGGATGGPARSPMRRLLARLEVEAAAFEAARGALLPGDTILPRLVRGWLARARDAVAREEAASAAPPPAVAGPWAVSGDWLASVSAETAVDDDASRPREEDAGIEVPAALARAAISRRIRLAVPGPGEWRGWMARHSRSFTFAARFFPPEAAARVARVYAWCRVTDDLVDRAEGETEAALHATLDEWLRLSRRAYEGRATGVELLDRAMGEMAAARVPFAHAAELVEGMRMDLRRETYPTEAALRVYTHRVASVVGLWLTELFGVHDAATLRGAAALGHAMQLTNILRDVGEDARAGRLYLPADLLGRHGIEADAVFAAAAARGPIPRGWPALLEEVMRAAENDYALGFAAIPRLPAFARRPVAVAAHVYRGIHPAIRRNGYDDLRRRAHTSAAGKALLAARALWALRRARPADAHAAWTGAVAADGGAA